VVKPVTKVEDSYTSDDFDDVSISGSGSSKLPSKPATTSKPMIKIVESSDIYESEDFESLSRS
jgi:hypothetical protein